MKKIIFSIAITLMVMALFIGNGEIHTDTVKTVMPQTYFLNSDDRHETVVDAGAELREKMKFREENVTILYKGNYSKELVEQIVNEAFAHTGVPTEGDYIRWHVQEWKGEVEYKENGTEDDIEIQYTIDYYTNGAQEEMVSEEATEILEALGVGEKKTDYEKIATIYQFLCQSIRYDGENKDNEQYKLKHSAYSALIDKKTVCQGYATLFYRLALESGIDARVITGISQNENHAWNIAFVDGLYYNLDATWDAELGNNTYFLKSDSEFPDHKRDIEYATEAFYAEFPMDKTDHERVMLKPKNITAEAKTEPLISKSILGRQVELIKVPAITLSWDEVFNATAYNIYQKNRFTDGYELYDTVEENKITIKTYLKKTDRSFKIEPIAVDADGKRIVGEHAAETETMSYRKLDSE